jgi:hypothetical protein
MSYSYIKSVFPNFENSNKVYDETLYTNINSSLYNEVNIQQVKPLENHNKENIVGKEHKKNETFILPSNNLLENLTNVDQYNTAQFKSQNNLIKSQTQTPTISQTRFDESPIARVTSVTPVTKNESKIEIECGDCDTYIKHILDCKQCKMLAIKHLSIESDKYRNEEMMELASYVIFGMFILLLIDSLKKDK